MRFHLLSTFLLLCLLNNTAWADTNDSSQNSSSPNNGFKWHQVEPGYWLGRYPLGSEKHLLKSEIFLLRFNPGKFSISILQANIVGRKRGNIRTMTKAAKGIAGINTHFFDEFENPLGLIISKFKTHRRIQNGGKLLTGIFFLEKNRPYIVHRKNFKKRPQRQNVELAVQAGPRLISKGAPLILSAPHRSSRRSGIAVTRGGDVILFATLLRFPGATFAQLQQMLLDKRLNVEDALNFDGGGSSQLFIEKNILLANDTFITGGDDVPVGLVVSKRHEG